MAEGWSRRAAQKNEGCNYVAENDLLQEFLDEDCDVANIMLGQIMTL